MADTQRHSHSTDPEKPGDDTRDSQATAGDVELDLTPDDISELTLAGISTEGPFDLEKFLRKLMKQ